MQPLSAKILSRFVRRQVLFPTPKVDRENTRFLPHDKKFFEIIYLLTNALILKELHSLTIVILPIFARRTENSANPALDIQKFANTLTALQI